MSLVSIFKNILSNQILISTLVGWALAQVIKIPIEYIRTREWNWAISISTGGMPSSHTAVVSGLAWAVGLWEGFDSTWFAISFVLAMVVIYDATGIRRQAGQHAQLINAIINDLASGHPIRAQHQKQLKEILGHTWIEAFAGIFWGVAVVWLLWLAWR